MTQPNLPESNSIVTAHILGLSCQEGGTAGMAHRARGGQPFPPPPAAPLFPEAPSQLKIYNVGTSSYLARNLAGTLKFSGWETWGVKKRSVTEIWHLKGFLALPPRGYGWEP